MSNHRQSTNVIWSESRVVCVHNENSTSSVQLAVRRTQQNQERSWNVKNLVIVYRILSLDFFSINLIRQFSRIDRIIPFLLFPLLRG